MDNKDSFQAAKILIDFIRDFTSLTERQLLAIRGLMEETVQDVMNSVMSMSAQTEVRRSQASEVLVKDDGNSEFHYSATKIKEEAEELSRVESADKRREFLENQLRRAGGVFSKHMEALHLIDHEVQDILFRVMGAVSMDDVMGQRLTHVVQSLLFLKEGISEVISNYDSYLQVKQISFLRNRILTQVYRSYTTEEEREIFHKIFGHPKEVKHAS